MPLQRVQRSQYDDDNQYGEEPLRVHHLLSLVPIAVHDVAEDEEREIEHELYQTALAQEIVEFALHATVSGSPVEIARQVARLIERQRRHEEQRDGNPRFPPQLALQVGEEVVHHKHVEQHDGKPIATLRRQLQCLLHCRPEVRLQDGHGQEEEHDGRYGLHLNLLPQQSTQIAEVPHLGSLVCQESADKEE